MAVVVQLSFLEPSLHKMHKEDAELGRLSTFHPQTTEQLQDKWFSHLCC
jgi:hypothetical protein